MTSEKTSREHTGRSLASSFERYLQGKGKGRGGDGGNYRCNAARELDRFAEWAAGDGGDDEWTGVVPNDADRGPTFEDLTNASSESTPAISPAIGGSSRILFKPTTATSLRGVTGAFTRATSRHTTRSVRARWRRSPRTTAASPATNRLGRLSSATRLTHQVNERARDAVEAYTTLPEDAGPLDKQWARYEALKAARDRALVFVLAYTDVRVGELLRDPNDPRRRGVR